jgi:hypothetical protein
MNSVRFDKSELQIRFDFERVIEKYKNMKNIYNLDIKPKVILECKKLNKNEIKIIENFLKYNYPSITNRGFADLLNSNIVIISEQKGQININNIFNTIQNFKLMVNLNKYDISTNLIKNNEIIDNYLNKKVAIFRKQVGKDIHVILRDQKNFKKFFDIEIIYDL